MKAVVSNLGGNKGNGGAVKDRKDASVVQGRQEGFEGEIGLPC
jgi:hypothetical protein